jgi:hypothetical protein
MSRTVSPALASLAGLTCGAALLVGCSSAQSADTPRTDSTRVTVASDADTGPSANNTDFASAKLRTVDPCGLLDGDTLNQLGKVSEPAAQSDIDSCQAELSDGKGNDLGVEIAIGGSHEAGDKPTGTIASLPADEESDSTACTEWLTTQRDPATGIEIRVSYTGDTGCVIARQLAGIVANRIRTNPPQRPAGTHSLAVIDPCGTIGNADAENLTAVGVDRTAEGLFSCDWQAGDYDLSVTFSLDDNPKDDTYDGTPQPVDVGVPAYAFPANDVYPSCDVKWEVRSVGRSDDQGEVVDVQFGDVLGGGLDPCTQAEAAAKIVAMKVPPAS